MSRDVKLFIGRRIITSVLLVIFFNIFYATNAFVDVEDTVENYTINIQSSDEEELVLKLINAERKKQGLFELKFDSRLMKLADLKTNDMLEENYVSHNSDKYGKIFNMLEVNNIEYKIAGENIARNKNAELAVKAWMNSKKHRENILEERYEYTGISVVKDKEYRYLFVESIEKVV